MTIMTMNPRSFKIDKIAVFDVVATVLVAELMAKLFLPVAIPRNVYYSGILLLTILVHIAVGQSTELNRKLASPLANPLYVLVVLLCITRLVVYFLR
jgi:hypothetical protein